MHSGSSKLGTYTSQNVLSAEPSKLSPTIIPSASSSVVKSSSSQLQVNSTSETTDIPLVSTPEILARPPGTNTNSAFASPDEATQLEVKPSKLIISTRKQWPPQKKDQQHETGRNFVIGQRSQPLEVEVAEKECPVEKFKKMGKKVTRVSTIAVQFGQINEKVLEKSVAKMAADRQEKKFPFTRAGSLDFLRPESPHSPRSPKSLSFSESGTNPTDSLEPTSPGSPMSPTVREQNKCLQRAGLSMRRKSVTVEGTDELEDRFEL
jgi:hypothetical protein